MKRFRLILTAVLVMAMVMGLLAVNSFSQEEEKPLVVAIDASFPPYTEVTATGESAGFDVDLIRAIAEVEDLNIELKPFPWEISITSLQKGLIDILMGGISIKCERFKVIDYSAPYFEAYPVLVSRSDAKITDVLHTGAVIGGLAGCHSYEYVVDTLREIGVNIKTKEYESTLLAIEDLKIGRIDGVAEIDTVVSGYIAAGHDIMIALRFLTPDALRQIGFAVTKGDPHNVVSKINDGLKRLYESGEYAKILHKWFPGKLVPEIPLPIRIICPEE